MENLKRNHIQKCIQWCEKNQLPHNKFIDKVNIFLTPKKKEVEMEEEETKPAMNLGLNLGSDLDLDLGIQFNA